ncbi:MAG: S8 family serine peptidase, partial [Chitinophagales bacterium]
MSWEGHLSGFVVGLLFAFIYRNKGLTQKEFQFSKTEFDDLFDEDFNDDLEFEDFDDELFDEDLTEFEDDNIGRGLSEEDSDLEEFSEVVIDEEGLEEFPEAVIDEEDLEEFPEASIDEEDLGEFPKAAIDEEDLEEFPEALTEIDDSLPWYIGQYHINQLWEETKGSGIKVALLDSGICLTHSDLSFEKVKDFTTDNGDANDTDGHGTHCAGIVCAKKTEKVVGLAPDCKLYVAKIAESDFDVTNDRVEAALKWAIKEEEVDIVMMSFSLRRRNEDIEKLLVDAKERVIFVGATSKFLYPSSYTGCIGVADIDKNQSPSPNFDRYKAVDIAAPGIGIHSTFKDAGYKTDSGSSMATAYVAGVLALLKSYANKENMDILPEKYAQILKETAKETTDFKIIQPLAALTQLKQFRIA